MQSNHGKYRRELVLGLLWIVYGFAMGCMVGLPWIVRGYAVGSGFCHVVCVFAVGIDWVWWWVVVLGLGWFGGNADWVWWWLFWVWVVGGCLRKRNGETEIRERNYYYYTQKKKIVLNYDLFGHFGLICFLFMHIRKDEEKKDEDLWNAGEWIIVKRVPALYWFPSGLSPHHKGHT